MSDKSYEQFADPIGLAKRLIMSGRLDAWWGLGQVPAKVLSGVIDAALNKLVVDRDDVGALSDAAVPGVDTADTQNTQLPQIFLIGGPRSGTTLCHQVLVHTLDVTYFSNFSDMFPRRTLWLSRKLGEFDQTPPRRFSSFYGVASGFRTPSDGFSFWNQWLGEHRYSVESQIDPKTADKLRFFFQQWQTQYPKPFMNKNNRNVDCAVQIAEILPTAHFIEIRREPVAVAKSLLTAREFIQGDRRRPWGLHSHYFMNNGSPVEQVCKQIHSFTRQLDLNKASIPSDRYHQVSFEEFLCEPATIVRRLCDQIHGLDVRDASRLDALEPFAASSSAHADTKRRDEEHLLLAQLLQ